MSNVILVNVGVGRIGFNSFGKGADESWVNHGIASLGAYLKMKSCEFSYLDLRKLKNWDHFIREISGRRPEVVGISATTVDYDVAYQAAKQIKSALPFTKTVLGGIHATVSPDECVEDGAFDHVVMGEGEITFYEIIKGEIRRKVIKGILMEDLDKIPFIDRKIFGKDEHPIFPKLFPKPFATFISSRGCPYGCSFCQPAERKVFGRRMRNRSPENLIQEIELCTKDMGIRSYLIHDDCMLWDREWTENFLSILIKNNIRIPFSLQSRADLICKNHDLIKSLTKVGLTMILIGFESGSQRILNFLRKGTTIEQNLKAAQICKNNNIAIWANYMFGIPGEKKTDVEKTVRMIRKIKPTVCSPSFFTPYPGSYLHAYCEERDLSLIKHYRDFGRSPEGKKIKGVDYEYLRRAVRISRNETILTSYLIKAKRKIEKILKL